MKSRNQLPRSGARQRLALVLVLVFAAFGFVEAVHVHDGPANDARPNSPTHCATCVAAHSAAVKAEASFAPVLSYQPGTTFSNEPQLESRLVFFSSFIRPPPAVL